MRFLKKMLGLAMLLAALSMIPGCGFIPQPKVIEPGHTGIKINRSGTNRGVDNTNLVQGRIWYCSYWTRVIEYPTFNQRVAWTQAVSEGNPANEELSGQTKDNVAFTMDMAVNYTLQVDKVPQFYNKYRADNISTYTHGYLRDQARKAVTDKASEYTFDEINGVKKEEFVKEVTKALAAAVGADGVLVGTNGVALLSNLRPPDTLRTAINARAQANQEAITVENQLRKSKAEAQKLIAEAEGIKASNQAKSLTVTPALLEWERLQNEKLRIAKWNGQYPTTYMGGAGVTPLLSVK